MMHLDKKTIGFEARGYVRAQRPCNSLSCRPMPQRQPVERTLPAGNIPARYWKGFHDGACFKVSVAQTAEPAPMPSEEDHMDIIREEMGKYVMIAQVAPAVRVALGEEFDLPYGTKVTGKIVAALRRLGFDYVFDVLAGADVTIMEEGTELIHRLKDFITKKPGAAPLPMFTSCCPGWIEFVEKCSPEYIPHISTAKSPHMMQGSLLKAFFSDLIESPEEKLRVVSIMPCVRKQGEADRMFYQTPKGNRQVDHVITTKGLAKMIKDAGIDFASLPDEHFDDFMGIGTGAAVIFGTTGGVMEAALRTVLSVVDSSEEMGRLDYEEVRGLDGVKEATVTVPPNPEGPLHNEEPLELRVAVANGLGNAKKLLKAAEEGNCPYHFIEVMACPGGCIGGGGQPRAKGKEALIKRQGALYDADKSYIIRKSSENPVVKNLYENYLGEPGSKIAHDLLHTSYIECGPPRYNLWEEKQLEDIEECEDAEICEVSTGEDSSGSNSE